jgi:hypothetical protein
VTALEITLLTASLLAIFFIFLAELLRGKFTKLPPPVIFAIRITLGIVFLILSVVGALLPVLQGWIFFLLAILMLFPQSRIAIKAIDKVAPKMPRLVRWLHMLGIGLHHDPGAKSPLDEK